MDAKGQPYCAAYRRVTDEANMRKRKTGIGSAQPPSPDRLWLCSASRSHLPRFHGGNPKLALHQHETLSTTNAVIGSLCLLQRQAAHHSQTQVCSAVWCSSGHLPEMTISPVEASQQIRRCHRIPPPKPGGPRHEIVRYFSLGLNAQRRTPASLLRALHTLGIPV